MDSNTRPAMSTNEENTSYMYFRFKNTLIDINEKTKYDCIFYFRNAQFLGYPITIYKMYAFVETDC